MKRRALLAILASGVSGCISPGGPANNPATPDGAEEPPNFHGADEVIYPAFESDRVELTAAPYEAELPQSTIEFRATNNTNTAFETNYEGWRMHKLVDDEWWFLGVFEPLQVIDYLEPSDSQVWEVTINNVTLGTQAEQLAPSATSFTVAGLGSGVYTFSIDGAFREGNTSIAIATPFTLGGEDVDIVPTPNIETTREGDTIQVNETDSSGGQEYQIEATRRTSTENVSRLVPEWGLRQTGIRNTVPFLTDEIQNVVFSRSGPTVFDRDRIDGTTFTYKDSAVKFNLIKV